MSSVHITAGDCVQEVGERLAKADLAPLAFEEAWRAFGIVVSALYRPHRTRPDVTVDLVSEAPPRPVVQTTTPTCPECGFESATVRGTTTHMSRMHPTKPQPTRRELWEKSHAPGLPYPGDAAVRTGA